MGGCGIFQSQRDCESDHLVDADRFAYDCVWRCNQIPPKRPPTLSATSFLAKVEPLAEDHFDEGYAHHACLVTPTDENGNPISAPYTAVRQLRAPAYIFSPV